MERDFQRAVSFLLQSRSVYQVSGDRAGEASARLTLAMVLLDFSTRQRQMLQEKAGASGRHAAANCTALLNDAEEQCRQALLACQDLSAGASVPADLDATIYIALAYLVRCYQRCTCILEERMSASPELSEETMKMLLNILKAELGQVEYPILDKTLR